MRAATTIAAAVVSGVVLTSCLSFNPASGTIRCSNDPSHPCPDGYSCMVGMCWRNGEQPDLAGGGGSAGGGGGEDMNAPTIANGSACTSGGDCISGNCVDGVCCDTSCDGACVACNLPGKAGTCSSVSVGSMPVHGTCTAEPKSSCGRDGTCDGAGQCRKWPSGTVCANGSCASGMQRSASQCDGSGNCVQGGTVACDPYVCKSDGTACYTQCTDNSQCLSPNPCNTSTGSCGPKNNGLGCGVGTDCKSGNCVDGYCCDTPSASCSGCKACNLPGSIGTCSNVPTTMDPHSFCTGKTCAAGGCNGAGACAASSSTTVCAVSSCSNTTDTYGQWVNISATVMTCDGSTVGSCPGAAMTQTCPGSLVCASGTMCKASCAVDADCTYPTYCGGGTCKAKGQYGDNCAANDQCMSGLCVSGKCRYCSSAQDCAGSGNPICDAQGVCRPCNTASDCTAVGSGDACNTSLLTCTCSSSSSCTATTKVDRCANLGDHMGCSCGTSGACGNGMTCTGGACKNVAGRPCVQSTDCASGTCSNGVCA